MRKRGYGGLFATSAVLLTLLLTLQTGTAAAAERPAKTLAAVTACRSIVDPAQRLACYDAAVGPFVDAIARGDLKVIDREEVRQTRRSLFGFELPRLPFFSGDDSVRDAPKEIDTTVASSHEAGYSNWSITMADGSVWQTKEPLPRDPRGGQAVKIKAGALGNYFLGVNGARMVPAARTH